MGPVVSHGTGVLVIGGSSGRLESDRARLLAAAGMCALAIRWFGGRGQQPGTYEVPLEIFFGAIDRLAESCEHIGVLGTSFGAEAALLVGTLDERVDGVIGIAPSPVVWAGLAPDGPDGVRQTSHWTLGGEPVPFVPFVEDWQPDASPPAYRDLYVRSLASHPREARAAAIPVERIRGEVVVVGGADDRVWPGADFARTVAQRRAEHGLDTTVVTHPRAGHRAVLPGEEPATGGEAMARGGSPDADAELGALAWPHLLRALGHRTRRS